MDIETSDAIELLRVDVRQGDSALRSEMVEMRTELRGEISSLRDELRGEMSSLRVDLMRHTDILFESLRDDIRIIAEGFASLDSKVDAIKRAQDAR